MDIRSLSLNTLRAFEASARHLNFTRAADELCVTQAAVSQQVKTLEAHIGKALFRRTTRGLVLSDEGALLAPVVGDALARMGDALTVVSGEGAREVLTLGAVGTFALSILLPRLPEFQALHPGVDVRLLTNNNAVDLWTESLDLAIRFGDGAWHGVHAQPLMRAPMAPMCSPALADGIRTPADLARLPLLRSYRARDWPAWFDAAGIKGATAQGPVFDASHLMALAAMRGLGVALLPVPLFDREQAAGQLVAPFDITVDRGGYWLTRLSSRPVSPAMAVFSQWLAEVV
ncbi:LysR family transcriptional regulator [Altererythrobacter xixiisoli]|uniref:LysR family transcriptional regulator n=1 Tax=Croceibacterium xixiisoli TaxID=1476466 RepID=A0A6I4TU57_9SPHN|nr:LysR family transcriptional regulator [Croceibacterium xixiisoli]MXO99444.1 LysR family transcriptional regulator [Croceibacterium xixiisoli]